MYFIMIPSNILVLVHLVCLSPIKSSIKCKQTHSSSLFLFKYLLSYPVLKNIRPLFISSMASSHISFSFLSSSHISLVLRFVNKIYPFTFVSAHLAIRLQSLSLLFVPLPSIYIFYWYKTFLPSFLPLLALTFILFHLFHTLLFLSLFFCSNLITLFAKAFTHQSKANLFQTQSPFQIP